jgi:lipopolysaccharide export system ATP-binding protein
MKVLSAQNLEKVYAKKPIVHGVSIEVRQGEIVGLLGPNGAGKTSCFYMIIGLVEQDGGEVKIGEENISDLPIHGRAERGLSYLPQEPSVFRKLSVKDNILSILEVQKSLSFSQRQNSLERLLEELKISHLRDSLGMSLSGGERRRVEIARALATDPKFILLDEPFAGVDPISVNDIKIIIRYLIQRGIGILITDHNVRETLDICHRAYIMAEGKVISEGTAKQILADKKVRQIYLGDNFYL